MITTILNPEIRQRLLNADDTVLSAIGSKMGNIQAQAVRANLRRNSPRLCLTHVKSEIKKQLNLPIDTEIEMVIDIETHLHI